ncbi:hypothetical protein Tco_0479607, partial [Tanacetum coccineum]
KNVELNGENLGPSGRSRRVVEDLFINGLSSRFHRKRPCASRIQAQRSSEEDRITDETSCKSSLNWDNSNPALGSLRNVEAISG